MAKLIDINKSAYINSNIEIYAKSKVGQYSKFLNKNPIFITYLPINQQQTRADVGTGAIESELGPNSPIRFNKILELPVYNFPEIKPDITFDESGYDIELDLTGITILPNTVKPMVSDYLIFSIPGLQKELLFRINNVTYNTIQSNDFYLIDIDIKDIGVDVESRLSMQIVDTYQTIFDNIGTQDKCFLLLEDLKKATSIVKMYLYLNNLYKNLFYNKECNSFVLYNNTLYPDSWLYDYFISKFIMDTNLYYTPDNDSTLMLTYNDTVPLNIDNIFNRTLLGAVYNRSIDYLNTFTYFYQSEVTKPFSPFVMNNYQCNSTNLYFVTEKLTTETSNSYENGYLSDYYSVELIEQIKSGILTSTDYLDEIIFNFMTGKDMQIDKTKITNYGLNEDLRTYIYLPIIMYIIRQYYDEYFKKS